MGFVERQRCISCLVFVVLTLLLVTLSSSTCFACNMYQGSWVADKTYPLYNSSGCPYIRQEYDCVKYGRPDRLYLQYRWQPSGCVLPRFDGKAFLNKFKGKKIMFIGDSVSANHVESLICLLHASAPNLNIKVGVLEPLATYTFQDYGLSISVFHSVYLVDIVPEKIGRVLKLDSLSNGKIWKDMDVLIFNTWLWWYRRGPQQPWDYVQYGEKVLKDMDRMEAFHKALTTWGNWVDSDVDTAKTKVVFQGISPMHYRGEDWGRPGVRNCAMEKQPISGSTYSGGPPPALKVVKEVLSGIKKPVHVLDITTLSQLRKDAHPSSYNGFHGMDCTHWCLAGVPDTWNELLFAALTQ